MSAQTSRITKATVKQLSFLARSGSALLQAQLTYKATLKKIVHLAVPEIADWCRIVILDEQKQIKDAQAVHKDPKKNVQIEKLFTYLQTNNKLEHGILYTLHTGKAQLMHAVSPAILTSVIIDPSYQRIAKNVGFSSYMIVPLLMRGNLIGAMTFVSASKKRLYTRNDLMLAKELAYRAALAIENTRLYEQMNTVIDEKEHSLALLNTLLDGAPVGFAFFDKKFRLIQANKQFLMVHPQSELSVHGKKIDDILSFVPHKTRKKFKDVMRTNTPCFNIEFTTTTHSTGDETRYWVANCYPVASQKKLLGIGMLVADITDRKHVEEQKDEFLTIVSHELKTPVTSIKAFSQFLLYNAKKKSAPQTIPEGKAIQTIIRQSNLLTDLVNAMLDLAKTSNGILPMEFDYFEITILLHEIVERMKFVYESYNFTLAAASSCLVYGNQNRIEQVIVNLISNAIQHSPEHSSIAISLSCDTTQITLSVSDQGKGIPTEKQEKVFERFYQAHRNPAKGLGLGLFIAKKIVEQHQGSMWLTSTYKKGSTFFFTLPLVKAYQGVTHSVN